MQIKLAVWVLRLVWLVQPLTFGPLLDDASSTLSDAGRVLVFAVAWTAWAVVLLATFVPSSVSLTIGRVLAPAGLAASLVGAFGASVSGWRTVLALAGSLLAILVWFSAETGLAFVQGSAYGNEQRFPLRPPVPYLAPIIVSWLVLAAASIGGVVLVANRVWFAGVACGVIAILLAWFLGPRFHQLSKRWFVVVPAGVVLHDPVLMADNALFRTSVLAALHLAPPETEAADLTGGTAGVAIEIVFDETQTVIKAGTRHQPHGVALHVLSVLVSPSRPGRALTAAAARRMPVG
jgi:hypothetical protein